jgi:3-methyladenine DNA glycosylase AlkD
MFPKNNLSMVSDILHALEALADPARIDFAKRTYPTELQVIGVTNPNLRLVLRELKAAVKGKDGRTVLKLAYTMINEEVFELQWLAYELIGSQKKTLRALTREDIDALNVHLDNWVLTDTFCGKVLGFAWREGVVDDAYLLNLQKSADLWQRRLAVVATTVLNTPATGGEGVSAQTLLLCQGAVDDHHPMISKAVSWALRTLVKWDRAAVEEFLEVHEDRLARLVVREVRRKLETGKKGG